jgi:glucokinase
MPWQQDHYEPLPTEGGHVDFAPRNDLQIELLKYLVAKLGRASYDTILSGKGLVHIYKFLIASGNGESSQAIDNEMQSSDSASVISYYGINEIDATAEQTLELFISIYGAQAGNLALTAMATGGIYIAGGIAPKIIERLNSDTFMNAFLDKAPMTKVMEKIPVRVIMNENVGLLGAVEVAIRTMASG